MPLSELLRNRLEATLARPEFRAWATRFPLTRPIARRRSQALFDLCAGFVYAQVLHACVELRLFDYLADGPLNLAELAVVLRMDTDRAELLLGAAVSLKLAARRSERYGLGPLGCAMVGNAAVAEMVRHHAMLYGDLADPVRLLRADPPSLTRLAAYWPYGTDPRPDELGPNRVSDYTALMAVSQPMVAAEVLDAYDVRRHRCLLDVGGGDGGFLAAALGRAPGLRGIVFDLPAVAGLANARFTQLGVSARAQALPGDMHRDALPGGADLISLVRVAHDHDDAPVLALFRAVHRALAKNGTLLLAEPMAGTPGAERIGDAYFAFYLLALGSGQARTPARLAALLAEAGFTRVNPAITANPLVTSVLIARP
jgi:demethylspheroidene O-methyltransferase